MIINFLLRCPFSREVNREKTAQFPSPIHDLRCWHWKLNRNVKLILSLKINIINKAQSGILVKTDISMVLSLGLGYRWPNCPVPNVMISIAMGAGWFDKPDFWLENLFFPLHWLHIVEPIIQEWETQRTISKSMMMAVAIWDLGFAAQCTQTIELGKTRDHLSHLPSK